MKQIFRNRELRYYIHNTLFLLLMCFVFSCETRDDKLFAATEEFQDISLYKGGNEFELLYNGVNSAKGTYNLSGDTIFLTYNKDEDGIINSHTSMPKHANDVLTRKLLIDTSSYIVRSIDNKSFKAYIYLDKRITK